MLVLHQWLKMAALAAVVGLAAVHWLDPLDTALVSVAVFYLLLVRAS